MLAQSCFRYFSSSSSYLSQVGSYDFRRYETFYNDGKKIRFPLGSLEIFPFIRPEVDETDEEVLQKHFLQHRIPLSTAKDTFFTNFSEQTSYSDVTWGGTKHGDATFIGLAYNPESLKYERYLLKFFHPTTQALKNARREVIFSYLLVESGLALNAPKIGLFEKHGLTFICRRFYKGTDGRVLLEKKAEMPVVKLDTLLKNYAIRYVVFGDLDFDNPGNILFTRHSSLTPEVLLNIDGEDIMPDEGSMQQFLESKWKKGDPIPGSLQWRREMSDSHTPTRFFKRMVNSDNPLLSYLRRTMDFDEIMELEIPPTFIDKVIEAQPWYEQLARSADLSSQSDLKGGKCDFQQTIARWKEASLQKRKVTLLNLISGIYSF
jgi:hypothetical protein